jgi:hypothetical protein
MWWINICINLYPYILVKIDTALLHQVQKF